ncbi:VRR-NUC domain-containing protein [Trichoderma breve]|uniref:Fanconi-associated nuclease n=1 Tax=Trichoderma breve TaxID=2034170 RepID=A0A9W9BEX5_9HYPO|nr:VRR-NUC domain-containing protein [Trichoderma breve]KAJ4861119.1 VRR-NUC domain-containing protein [Trichoderma breve]
MDAFVKRLSDADAETRDAGRSLGDASSAASRPSKRLKRDNGSDSESEEPSELLVEYRPQEVAAAEAFSDETDQRRSKERVTEFENALPPTETNEEAITEYETLRSSQNNAVEDSSKVKTAPLWIKGRSSIYVDAFNLALDTVLEEESSLFSSKESEIFKQWRSLNYEAQYLYVRLFLRKTAAWHRSSRLGYFNDISDHDSAIATLQESRTLPLEHEEKSPVENQLETPVEEAASLLYLDELKALAKEAKIQGKTKMDMIKALCRVSQQQAGLLSLGISRQNSRDSNASEGIDRPTSTVRKVKRENSNREQHFLAKILAIVGPCIRISPATFTLFERVHLVFYRSTEWTEKSLTTIILAKIARRNFPEYLVCRSSTIFASRSHLLEYEAAIHMEAEVDNVLEFNGPLDEKGSQKILGIFERVYPRWKVLIEEETEKERQVYEMGEGAYLRRFNPAHSYTRIIVKAAFVLGKLKRYAREHELLTELLEQRLFHLSRRGSWYQRKALLEEHYMPSLDPELTTHELEQQKKRWRAIAVSTCETGLQDPDCHLIHHYDLQKRLVKLEKKLRIPKRLQHDFGHVRLADPLELSVEGVQLKKNLPLKPGGQAASTRTMWLDDSDSGGVCTVEEMCLNHFRSQGWKGYHAEGGIIRTLFAYLFYDILFLYIPNVFQTAFQTCPLDLHTDAFFPARTSEINHRLVEIANGEGERLLRGVWEREHERRTSVIGLNWDFPVEDLTELVRCFQGSALAALCKVMAQEYRQRGGGIPDLVLWRMAQNNEADGTDKEPGKARGEAMFVEVKSANDRLSDTQRLWIHVLTGAGVKVALCNAVAKEIREIG